MRKWAKKNINIVSIISLVTTIGFGLFNITYTCTVDRRVNEFEKLNRQPRFVFLHYYDTSKNIYGQIEDNFVIEIINRGFYIDRSKFNAELFTFVDITKHKDGIKTNKLIPLLPHHGTIDLIDTSTLTIFRTDDIDQIKSRFNVDEFLVKNSNERDLFLSKAIYLCRVTYQDVLHAQAELFYYYDSNSKYFMEISRIEAERYIHSFRSREKINLTKLTTKEFADILLN